MFKNSKFIIYLKSVSEMLLLFLMQLLIVHWHHMGNAKVLTLNMCNFDTMLYFDTDFCKCLFACIGYKRILCITWLLNWFFFFCIWSVKDIINMCFFCLILFASINIFLIDRHPSRRIIQEIIKLWKYIWIRGIFWHKRVKEQNR